LSDEKVTTYDKLVNALRHKLYDYVDRIITTEDQYFSRLETLSLTLRNCKKSLQEFHHYTPKNIVALDGASATFNLEIGRIGMYLALAIIFPSMKRIYVKDSYGIVPEDPSEITEYRDPIIFNRLLDLRRERKIFELATYIVENIKEIEVVLIDGPLLPTPVTGLENIDVKLNAEYVRYFKAIERLHKLCYEEGIILIGFVKRVRSKLIKGHIQGLKLTRPENLERDVSLFPDTYDSILVDILLDEGELFPYPPIIVEHLSSKNIRVLCSFVKTKEDATPYRIDVAGGTNRKEESFNKAVGLILEHMTIYGIPYPILKIDEEVKLSRRLVRELYDDLRYRCFMKTHGRLISLKAIWGEFL